MRPPGGAAHEDSIWIMGDCRFNLGEKGGEALEHQFVDFVVRIVGGVAEKIEGDEGHSCGGGGLDVAVDFPGSIATGMEEYEHGGGGGGTGRLVNGVGGGEFPGALLQGDGAADTGEQITGFLVFLHPLEDPGLVDGGQVAFLDFEFVSVVPPDGDSFVWFVVGDDLSPVLLAGCECPVAELIVGKGNLKGAGEKGGRCGEVSWEWMGW